MWLGVTTETDFFMQIDAAWGKVNCLEQATGAPIFSAGETGFLSNCPIATVKEGDTYLIAIFFDYQLTGDWWMVIDDESTGGTPVTSSYFSGSSYGTHIPLQNLGLVMEGSSSSIGGPQIPDGYQNFVDPQYWDDLGNTYYWTQYPTFYCNNVPTNIEINQTFYSYGLGVVQWTCNFNC